MTAPSRISEESPERMVATPVGCFSVVRFSKPEWREPALAQVPRTSIGTISCVMGRSAGRFSLAWCKLRGVEGP